MNYRPSQLAASSVIIAINIYKDDLEENTEAKKQKKLFDLSFWNCEEVAMVTGYGI